MIFKTKRLIIRKFVISDLIEFYDMLGNHEVMKFIKPTLNYEESKKELKRFISYYDNKSKEYNIWAVVQKEKKMLIGLCGYYLNKKEEYEMAYRLRKSFWGNGYGLELVTGLLIYVSKLSHIYKIVAYVDKENNGSIKILNKLKENNKETSEVTLVENEFKYSFKNKNQFK